MLKILRFLTLPIMVLGGLYVVFNVAMYFITVNAGRSGELDIGTVADATTNALKGVAIGIVILVATFVVRAVIIARMKKVP